MDTLLEAGMYKYMIDNPGRLCRTAEFMKRFYYGNSSRVNGLEEMESNSDKIINSKKTTIMQRE